jgi:CheY-like chemotaxis protein
MRSADFEKRASGRTLLIVEDDADIREALAGLLEMEGFHVIGCPNGREGLDWLRKSPKPDLILLDLMMPVMSGEEFIDIRTKDPVLSKIPVCVLTASDRALPDREDIAARLRKPVDSKSVMAIVERHCQPMA